MCSAEEREGVGVAVVRARHAFEGLDGVSRFVLLQGGLGQGDPRVDVVWVVTHQATRASQGGRRLAESGRQTNLQRLNRDGGVRLTLFLQMGL